MIYEMTIQVRVSEFEKGQQWYTTLLKREPDFIPHEGFAEWELLPGCWLQVAEGHPSMNSGPIRLGVLDIEEERNRVQQELGVESFELHSREEVPVRWGTFADPWGNQLGFFEYKSEAEKKERIRVIVGDSQ
ncbi:VOC family protein [Sporosarcina sp. ACRSL]|uniref:VOC family protein n=1 Tax=Sporosarcina sp. ACRSL TaxID=2918215 RepID=UPI001EF59DDE|nr:VOC family protein [Sporosarcina sp. ACRSL]MCG7343170.1 VOC family protein [Sporosarcina sp. ACRSL]